MQSRRLSVSVHSLWSVIQTQVREAVSKKKTGELKLKKYLLQTLNEMYGMFNWRILMG